LTLNEGIRWLELKGEAVNRRGDMRGERHSREGLLILGEVGRISGDQEEIVWEHFSRGGMGKL
jgi:hypothetical protein